MYTAVVPLDFNNQPNGHLWAGSLPRCHSALLLSLTHGLSSAAPPAPQGRQAAPWPCCQPLSILCPSLAPSPAPSLGGKSHRSPLGRPSFLQPCNDPPSARKKPGLTRDSYLGQHNAEMRERKNVSGGYFCASSWLLQPVRDSSLDLQQPQGADY